jgi:hypothetical protein
MLAEHWNGTQWSKVTTPDVATSDEKLLAVNASAASEAWAVGFQAAPGAQAVPLAIHWNGTAWTAVTAPPPVPAGTTLASSSLTGIAATSATDIWAVGNFAVAAGLNVQGGTLILHYDGTAWKVINSPNGTGPSQLFGVAATAQNDAWAVGDVIATDGSGQPAQTLVMHWNGTKWTIVTSPSVNSNPSLLSVSAASATDVWAVGVRTERVSDSEVHSVSLIEHWDGATWSMVPTPSIPDLDHGLLGVSATPAAAFAVGQRLTSPVTRTLILQH